MDEAYYSKAKQRLLGDEHICSENRSLFRRFFEYQEHKLKRTNQLARLDIGCYRTLFKYTIMFRNVNNWFKGRPWEDLRREEIQRVYDDLEDGVIKSKRGGPVRDRSGYYSKVFKSKPFRLAGKDSLARDVLEYHTREPDREVRFVTEEDFRKLIAVVSDPKHLLLLWLAWDVGENVGALLKLTPRQFSRQPNPDTRDPEYLVTLPKEILKRSRRPRSEPTLYPETVRYADIVLKDLGPDAPIFHFGHRMALKLLHAAVRRSGAVCKPHDDKINWKDLRSGMACHLLKHGWSRDEVNARLGHTPNSDVLNAYINYLALDRHRPKKKLEQSRVEDLKDELEAVRQREKLAQQRFERQQEENSRLFDALREMRKELTELRGDLKP